MNHSIQITVNGTIFPIIRDVAYIHPAPVHAAMGTSTEIELQHALDTLNISDWYREGRHLGPDSNGLEMFEEDESPLQSSALA